MSSFLTNHGVVVALVCASFAVIYGLLTTRALLALSPGSERMQTISRAVQEGARAYLNRQYTTIAAVGVVVFVALIFIQNIAVACGFAIGGVAPVGHLTAPLTLLDADLLRLDPVWAAAGAPHLVFRTTAAELQRMSGAAVHDIKA